jgi:uncharacterized protein
MEINPTLLEKVKQENHEFGKLYEAHSSLKGKVETLNRMKVLTPEQELEKKKNQKQKLNLKDKMEKILSQYPRNLN